MQRKRGGLVPIGEVVSDLDVPVPAIPAASPQARHSFTVADQVHQLVSASEADPGRRGPIWDHPGRGKRVAKRSFVQAVH